MRRGHVDIPEYRQGGLCGGGDSFSRIVRKRSRQLCTAAMRTILAVELLNDGSMRFGEIRRTISGISQPRMLQAKPCGLCSYRIG